MTSPRILYNRSLLSGARPYRRRHYHPRRRAGIPRSPAQLLPPPSQSTYQGRRREYKASNPGSFAPSNSSAPTRFRSNCSASCPAFKSLRAQRDCHWHFACLAIKGLLLFLVAAMTPSRKSYISKVSRLPRRRVQVCSRSRITSLPLVSDLYMHYAVFRRVVWTSEHSQFVIITGPSGGQLGEVCKRDIVHKDPIRTMSHRFIPWASILSSRPAPQGREESHRRRSSYSPCVYQP